ncbi:MAG: glycosyltransferase [Salinivirgaceae bacterium]|nr:glycosyltransferase [Salinivirgaceae bacterium]
MKVLFITHHYLSGNNGGAFASRAYINAFAEVADEMTLFYPVKEGQNLFDGINPKIKTIPVAYAIPKWRKLIHALTGKVHRYFKATKEFLSEKKADVVVFDTSVVTFRIIKQFKDKGYRTIVIHHNYQYEYFRDNCKNILRPFTLFWCKRYERQAVQNADINLTLTPQDIDLLADNYNNGAKTNFCVLGAFEHINSQPKKIIDNTKKTNRFVITGGLDSVQTYVSLKEWINEYYDLLKTEFPESSLTIAGKNPSLELINLCKQRGIIIIASPPNMDDILQNADYYICPTNLGGGLKLRIMDGLKWGLPVVTHAVSARGYEAFKDAGCLFSYSNIEEFTSAIRQLNLQSMSKREIQTLYSSLFSFYAGIKRLRKVFGNN